MPIFDNFGQKKIYSMSLNIKPSNISNGRRNEMCEAKPTPTPLICVNLIMYPYVIMTRILPFDTTILAYTHVEQFLYMLNLILTIRNISVVCVQQNIFVPAMGQVANLYKICHFVLQFWAQSEEITQEKSIASRI